MRDEFIRGLLIIPRGIAELILKLISPSMLGFILGSSLLVISIILFLNWLYS